MPALLTAMSSRPCSRTTPSTSAAMASASLTSASAPKALGPIEFAVSLAAVPLTSARITVAPSVASRRAIASPMPEAAPVTRATLPSRRCVDVVIVLPFVCGGDGRSGCGTDVLPARLPAPAVAGVEGDVQKCHALQVARRAERTDVDRSVADLVQDSDDGGLGVLVVAGNEPVELGSVDG